MGEGFNFLDIILLAMVAAFILLRLRSVLGRRTGHEQQNPRSRIESPGGDVHRDDNVISLPDRDGEPARGPAAPEPEDDTPLGAALTKIALADRSFDKAQFLEGARAAYEMIVTAFAAGDRKTLEPFLSDNVMENFGAVIDQREKSGQTQETTLVGIKSAEIIEAELDGRTAGVTVKFVSDMISVTKDSSGEVVAGDPAKVSLVTDIWTFSRNTRSRDPNWALTATRSSN
ncbi:MAG: Tim44/TimA family putative adaptor protein [Minwuiales bacterium]|nr:Tim44/TimA family putative adaptor protein [Minwuiales bacterium]